MKSKKLFSRYNLVFHVFFRYYESNSTSTQQNIITNKQNTQVLGSLNSEGFKIGKKNIQSINPNGGVLSLFKGFGVIDIIDITNLLQLVIASSNFIFFIIDGSSGAIGSLGDSGNNGNNGNNNGSSNGGGFKSTNTGHAILISTIQKLLDAGVQIGSMTLVAGVIMVAFCGIGALIAGSSNNNNNDNSPNNDLPPIYNPVRDERPPFYNPNVTDQEKDREITELKRENDRADNNPKPEYKLFDPEQYFPKPSSGDAD